MSKKIALVLLAVILTLATFVLSACSARPEKSTAPSQSQPEQSVTPTQSQPEQSVTPTQQQPEQSATPTQSQAEYLFNNDWLNKNNIYVYGQPPLDYLRLVNATGVTWAVYWAGLNSRDREYLETLHKNGFKVSSNLPTVQGDIDLVRGDNGLLERASCRDFNGETSYLSWVSEKRVYFMCHNNPEWQEFLKNRIKENIDGGADAIQIDEIEGNGSHLELAGFCDYCIKGFKDYLMERYSAADLLAIFGINNIESFDYRGYLHANNVSIVWEDPNPDLLHEFMRFQYSSRQKQINDLIQYARDYAGRDILFSANIYGLIPNSLFYILALDFIVSEMPIGTLPAGKQFVRYLLSEAIDASKPFVAFPDISDLAKLSTEDWRLWRHWLAEAYACNASFLLPYQAYTYGGGAFTVPAEKLSDYTGFIASYPDYYQDTSELADVAVLYSLESTLVDWSAWENYLNLGQCLQEAHVPFKVIFCGDSQLFPAVPDAGELARYRLLVIPPGHFFNEEVSRLLEQYSQQGGQILTLNAPGEIQDISSRIKGIGVQTGLETNASGNLGITINRKDDAIIAHIVNYNYDYGIHDFIPENGVEITLDIPESLTSGDKTLKLISPDFPEATLSYSLTGNRLTFTIPEIYVYSIVLFE